RAPRCDRCPIPLGGDWKLSPVRRGGPSGQGDLRRPRRNRRARGPGVFARPGSARLDHPGGVDGMERLQAHRGAAEYAEVFFGREKLRALCVSAVPFCFCLSFAAAAQTVGAGSPAVNAPGGLAAAAETPAHPIEISGYAILNGAWTQADPSLVAVGRNNGFALGDARIELTGRPADSLWL